MITKKLGQVGGGRFPAAGYNEDKVLEGVADLLLARNVDERFLRQLDIMHAVGINAGGEVERYMKEHSKAYGNSKTQNKQFHVALSVKEHEMDRYELGEFAERFMERMGYGNQPYFVYFHHDTGNNHVHILSTRINRYGIAISDSFDKMRMQRVTEEILGVTPDKERQKLFSYTFQSEGQFLNVARSCGYNPKEEMVDGVESYTFFRNHYPQFSIPKREILSRMVSKEDSLSMKNRKERARQLKAILLKYRQLSLQQQQEHQGRARKKSDLEGRKTMALSGLRHKDGTPFNETEKLQVKWMLKELRQKLGIDIHWQKDKNGIVRGYGIVDHKTKTAFDGSQVLRMAEWIEPQRKENEEKGQKVKGTSKREESKTNNEVFVSLPEREYLRQSQKSIGSSGQSTPKLTNVDSIYIAKHKNGKYYLRVVINNYGRSVMFFLSKEETRAYLLAADAMERERLKQQFAFKYLLRASGGSYDQNREWEVGNGYDDDNGRGLKR